MLLFLQRITLNCILYSLLSTFLSLERLPLIFFLSKNITEKKKWLKLLQPLKSPTMRSSSEGKIFMIPDSRVTPVTHVSNNVEWEVVGGDAYFHNSHLTPSSRTDRWANQ